MPKYNKLVRDHIPAIVKLTGKNPVVKTLSEDEFASALKRKLREETKEYMEAESGEDAVKELADILEVVHALAEVEGVTSEELEAVRTKKAGERGAFRDKVCLLEVNDGED
ncbi:MAG TPA: nucleoside triphosphate pyrophosphohydrolase [Bacillales bacterium]